MRRPSFSTSANRSAAPLLSNRAWTPRSAPAKPSTTARRLREARFPDLKTLGQID